MGKVIDLTGKVFGKLTVIGRAENDKGGNSQWNCSCECGENTTVRAYDIKSGKTKSCGCPNFIDLTGKTFFRLTVIGRGEKNKYGQKQWNCSCECGENTNALSNDLTHGRVKSCGCLNIEKIKTNKLTHGMSYTSEYRIWTRMKQRCYSDTTGAKNYRDRGIKVCDRWLESFENFYEDMGSRPSPKHSIDRIDNDGDYCPENCRWATRTEQQNNTSKNVRLTLNGETKTMTEWARVLGISPQTIRARNRKGWSDEKVLTTP